VVEQRRLGTHSLWSVQDRRQRAGASTQRNHQWRCGASLGRSFSTGSLERRRREPLFRSDCPRRPRLRRDHRDCRGHLAPSQQGSDLIHEGGRPDRSHLIHVEPVPFRFAYGSDAFGTRLLPAHDGSHDPVVLRARGDPVTPVGSWRHGRHGSLLDLRPSWYLGPVAFRALHNRPRVVENLNAAEHRQQAGTVTFERSDTGLGYGRSSVGRR